MYQCAYGYNSEHVPLALDLAGLQQAHPEFTITIEPLAQGSNVIGSGGSIISSWDIPKADINKSDSIPFDDLAQIQENPPSCVHQLNTAFTELYYVSTSCWSQPYPPGLAECLLQRPYLEQLTVGMLLQSQRPYTVVSVIHGALQHSEVINGP